MSEDMFNKRLLELNKVSSSCSGSIESEGENVRNEN